MNHKILVVDDVPAILAEVRHILSKKFDVHTTENGNEALAMCQTVGPFAVVLTDHGMPGMTGTELLAHMQKGWPDTSRIMMTGYADLDLSIKALHEGHIFRFLQKPFRPRDLIDAVNGGVDRFARVEEERLLTEQLQFSRESLLSLTESLETRLASQIGRMRGLQRFSLDLANTQSLEEIGDLTAEATSKLLESRPVAVRLNESGALPAVEGRAGGALPIEVHEEPIRVHEGEIGTIRISDRDASGARMTESDRETLVSIACVTAIVAHNRLTCRARDLAHDATIFALARLAENRDDETGKHLERISEYSRLIAESIRASGRHRATITDGFIRDLTTSAPLHDIGKVGIPDSILLKPGKLTEAEWDVMKRHAAIGARTLRNILEVSGEQAFLRMGHDIAWAHHEKWDGTDYPRGLSGEDIPLSARIVAIADCYDALTSWRPYKAPWSHAETIAHLGSEAGSHFDPDVVAAVERCAAEFDSIRRRLGDTREEVEAKRAA